jgi:hypothetical protein
MHAYRAALVSGASCGFARVANTGACVKIRGQKEPMWDPSERLVASSSLPISTVLSHNSVHTAFASHLYE